MSTAYIYNGFGAYDTLSNDQKAHVLKFAGVEFPLPYDSVTAIPDYTFRELDHDKSTPAAGYRSELTYMLSFMRGNDIGHFLTEGQVPDQNKDMGIVIIQGKPTGRMITVVAGADVNGFPIYTEVKEVEPTRAERDAALRAAQQYKERIVQDYFQSKREAMTSGIGRRHPDARIRQYMEELGVEDNDDITRHQKSTGGLNTEQLVAIVKAAASASEVNLETLREAIASVRKSGNEPQLAKAKPKSLGLADNARRYDEAQKAKENG